MSPYVDDTYSSGGGYAMMVEDKPMCQDGDDACKMFHMQMALRTGQNLTFLFGPWKVQSTNEFITVCIVVVCWGLFQEILTFIKA